MRIAAAATDLVRRAAKTEALVTTGVANGLTMACGFAAGVATARGLSTAGRGVLFGVVLAGTVAAWVAVLGADEAIVFMAQGDRARAEEVRRSFAPALRRQAAAAVVVLAGVVLVITRHTPLSTRLVCVVAMAVMIPCGIYGMAGAGVLRAAQQYRQWNIARVLPSLIYAVASVVLFVPGWLTSGRGVVAFALGSVATAVLVRHWVTGAAQREGRGREPVEPLSRELRRYGAQVTIFGAPYLVNQRLDQFYLSLFLAPVQLGLYSVAIALTSVLQTLAGTLEQVLFPVLMARSSGRRRLTREALVGTVAVAGAVAAALVVAAPMLVRWVFGDRYAGAARPAQILLVGTVFVVCGAPLVAYGKSRDRVKVLITAQAVAAVVTVVALFPAVARFGIAGAAAVSSAAYAIAFGVMLGEFVRASRRPAPARDGAAVDDPPGVVDE